MSKFLKIGVLLLAAPLFLASCGKEEPQESQPIKKAPAAAPAPPAAGQVDTAAAPDASAVGVHRNPFQSHILLMKGVEAVKKIKGPLECCELSTFKLSAVVIGGEHSFGLVQATDGKRYVVRKGDLIGTREGKIVKIYTGGITVREYSRDQEGKVINTEDTDLRLPSEKK
ncbi:MAG: pilus assembly protein PilP [Deltaproteobacteria bacterium]|nr:pilus assembly protein PilP [Deltaproteobacteria bacterium]